MMTMRVKIIVECRGFWPTQRSKKANEMMVEKPDTGSKRYWRGDAVADVRCPESSEIFRGANEIVIRHDGALYRMKITRQGKLILNK